MIRRSLHIFNIKIFDKREALSKMMRHSQQTNKNYLKVSNIEKVQPNEKIKELEKEIILLNKMIEEYNVKLKAYE